MRAGFEDEIAWAEDIKAPTDAIHFALEYIWVVLNSGMRNTVARLIEAKILDALYLGHRVYPPDEKVFRHEGKCKAIQNMWDHRDELFEEFNKVKNDTGKVMDLIVTLPYTKGKTIRWHYAKNLGIDVAKPDRHLLRIAERYKTTTEELCRKLSIESGDRIATVDLVIWRACERGFGYVIVDGGLWQPKE